MVRRMARILIAAAFSLAAAMAAQADEIVTPEEFGDYATGYTVYFELYGERFGEETYFENNMTLWRDQSGLCQEGTWYAKGDEICFTYRPEDPHVCWLMLRDEEGMYARLTSDGRPIVEPFEIRVAGKDGRPLPCAYHGV